MTATSATPACSPIRPRAIAGLLEAGRRALYPSRDIDARREAEILLCLSLGKRREYVFSWPDRTVSDATVEKYRSYLQRRAEGWPIAYLTGHREFWSLPLRVDRHTLIPRHETETLVETVLENLVPNRNVQVADIGCGCGAIAFAIAHARPGCRVLATDDCQKALRVAKMNLERLAPIPVTLRLGHWFAPLAGQRFDWIVSNPPYLSSSDPHLSLGDPRFEPRHALVADDRDGTACLKHLIRTAPSFLAADGVLAVEHGYDQGETVRNCFARLRYRNIYTRPDLSNRERVTLGVAPIKHSH